MTLTELSDELESAVGDNPRRARAYRDYADSISTARPKSAAFWRAEADKIYPLTQDEKYRERELK